MTQKKEQPLLVVTIRTVRFLAGNDGNGNANREQIDVKLIHDSKEYLNFVENLKNMGFGKASVLNVKEKNAKGDYNEIAIPKEISQAVNAAMGGVKKPTPSNSDERMDRVEKLLKSLGEKNELLSEENEILKDQLASALTKAGVDSLIIPNGEENANYMGDGVITEPTLSAARAEYKEKFGKLPHNSWSVEQINEKIKEFQNS
jgi:uncharacterized protein YrzB (UPF0473 family)